MGVHLAVVIRSGPADVIDTGMVTTFGGGDLALTVGMPEGSWVVELAFLSDSSTSDVSVGTTELASGIRFECVNFDDADGRGSAVPVLLGELGDDLVFFHFRVFRFGRTEDRTVHYTVYRAKKVDVGWSTA